MIETLLILSCFYGSADSCENSAKGYYSYSGIEATLTQQSQIYTHKYPTASALVGWSAAAFSGRIIFPIGVNKTCTIDQKNRIIAYGVAF